MARTMSWWVVALTEKYASLGKLYEAPKLLRDMAAAGKKFFA